MEITTLARAFPNRILPGFGHGVGPWMAQIGAAPKSSLKALGETVTAVRQLLGGELVTTHGEQVKLDQVQMQLTPAFVPPSYIGAMREKSLQLAGRVGDGTILTGMSSPEYVRWARENPRGAAEAGRSQPRAVVYLDVKVNRNGELARAAVRRSLAARLPWADVQINALGIADEVAAFIQAHGIDGVAQQMPDEWLDAFSAAGTPDQVENAIQRWIDAGANSVVFQPLDGDPTCLDEYIRYLMPVLNDRRSRSVLHSEADMEPYTSQLFQIDYSEIEDLFQTHFEKRITTIQYELSKNIVSKPGICGEYAIPTLTFTFENGSGRNHNALCTQAA